MTAMNAYTERADAQLEGDLEARAASEGERLCVEPITLSSWAARLTDASDPAAVHIEAAAFSRRGAMVALLHKDDRLRRRARR